MSAVRAVHFPKDQLRAVELIRLDAELQRVGTGRETSGVSFQLAIPLTLYAQHLPHWRQDGATYFITFRLHDSLPQSKLSELRSFRSDWERRPPPPRSREALDELTREIMQRVEAWLDQGLGSCALRSSEVSALMVKARHQDDGVGHELGCYVVMPNHVHAVVRPLNPVVLPLEKILQRWKGASAYEPQPPSTTVGDVLAA